jgi:hypothetical protein
MMDLTRSQPETPGIDDLAWGKKIRRDDMESINGADLAGR